MKKIILGIIIGVLISCTAIIADGGIPTKYISSFGSGNYPTQVRVMTIKSHEYIIVSGYHVGASIIHAEHCKCKNKR